MPSLTGVYTAAMKTHLRCTAEADKPLICCATASEFARFGTKGGKGERLRRDSKS